jgi:aryl-alcohol dehydrogenase-like predicted oxidoreductase
MDTRRFGRSGWSVGAVGLGCWAIGGPFSRESDGVRGPMGWGDVDDAESIRAIHRALDLGATLFDTANNYGTGHSERVLGRALAGRVEDVVVATKFGSVFDETSQTHYDDRELTMTREAIGEACDASLRRLGRETIDLYLLHHGEYELDRAPEVVAILEELVAAGKIRAYGWSTDDPDRARVFAEGPHCTAIEFRMNLTWPAAEMLRVCDELDLACVIRSPLNGGILSGKFKADSTFPPNDERHGLDFGEGRAAFRLAQVEQVRGPLTRDGRSLTQAAISWILTLSDRTIPIPGFKTVAQVEELVAAAELPPLEEDQLELVDELAAMPAP